MGIQLRGEAVIDYSKGKNLASDIISNNIRVSTATFPRNEYYGGGEDALIETWIFDDRPLHSKQYFHKHGRDRAIKFHNYLVRRLRRYANVVKWFKPTERK